MSKIERDTYTRSLEDELEWKLIDQLHGAVSQLSGFCFETKKFCITTLFAVLAFITKFTNEKLDSSLFITVAIITVVFWFLDSTSYFYQVKLRGRMQKAQKQLIENNKEQPSPTPDETPEYIAPSRVDAPLIKRVMNAGLNNSMWIYAFLLIINSICWELYRHGNFS